MYDDFMDEMQMTNETLIRARQQRKRIEEEEQAARKQKYERRMKIERFSEYPKIRRY